MEWNTSTDWTNAKKDGNISTPNDVSRLSLDPVAKDRLVSRYRFDGDFTDDYGNNDGTVSGSDYSFVSGNYSSKALDLGDTSYIDLADFALSGDNALVAWIKTPKEYTFGDSHTGSGWFANSNQFGFNDGGSNLSWNAPTNQWHLVVFQLNSGTQEIWLDGSLQGTNGSSKSWLDAGVARINNGGYNCTIDEVRMYNGSLTKEEILTMHERKIAMDGELKTAAKSDTSKIAPDIKAKYSLNSQTMSVDVLGINAQNASWSHNWESGSVPSSLTINDAGMDVKSWSTDAADRTRGTYSFGSASVVTNPGAQWQVPEFDGGQPVSSLTFYYNEDNSSTGGGFRIKNSNGNFECSAGTENPQYFVYTGDGHERIFDPATAYYDIWIKVTFDFDWVNNEVTITFDDQSGNYATQTVTRPLREGVDVQSLEFWNHDNGTVVWGDSNALYMWFDDLSATYDDVGEKRTIKFDGKSSYNGNWNNSYDTFQAHFHVDSKNLRQTPRIDSLTLDEDDFKVSEDVSAGRVILSWNESTEFDFTRKNPNTGNSKTGSDSGDTYHDSTVTEGAEYAYSITKDSGAVGDVNVDIPLRNADIDVSDDKLEIQTSPAVTEADIEESVNGGSYSTLATISVDDTGYGSYSFSDSSRRFSRFRITLKAPGDNLTVNESHFFKSQNWFSEGTQSRFNDERPEPEVREGDWDGESPTIEKNPNWESVGDGKTSKLEELDSPSSVLSGSGTSVAINSTNKGLGSSVNVNYGQPLRWQNELTKDAASDWPVTVKSKVTFTLEDPSSLNLDDLMIQSYMEKGCNVETFINNVSVNADTGRVIADVRLKYSCPKSTNTNDKKKTVKSTTRMKIPAKNTVAKSPDVTSSVVSSSVQTKSTSVNTVNTEFSAPLQSWNLSRYGNIGGASCVPSGEQFTTPFGMQMEWEQISKANIHVEFDPGIVNVATAGVTGENGFSATVNTKDNTNGVLDVTLDGNTISASLESKDMCSITWDAVGSSSQTSPLTLIDSKCEVYNENGNEITNGGLREDGEKLGSVNWKNGLAKLENGVSVNNGGNIAYGQTKTSTLSVNAGSSVSSATWEIQFHENFIVNDVRGVDMTLDSWSVEKISGKKRLTIKTSASTAVDDPILAEIDWYAPHKLLDDGYDFNAPDYPKDVKHVVSNSSLTDSLGSSISTSCYSGISLSGKGNLKEQQKSKDGGFKIPETGVVYWPLIFPVTYRIPSIDQDKISRETLTLVAESETNPDIYGTIDSVQYGIPGDQDSTYVYCTVIIPKADPQNYPVQYAAWLKLGSRYITQTGMQLTNDIHRGPQTGKLFLRFRRGVGL